MNVNDVFIELMKEKQLPDLVVQDYWGTITLQKQMKHSNSLALVDWSLLYSMPNTELAVLLTSKVFFVFLCFFKKGFCCSLGW